MINNPVVSSTGGGSSLPGLREVTAEEFLQVNKGLMLALHRDFVCGVPYFIGMRTVDVDIAFINDIEPDDGGETAYRFIFDYASKCALVNASETQCAAVSEQEGVVLTGNFYAVKLFEVVE